MHIYALFNIILRNFFILPLKLYVSSENTVEGRLFNVDNNLNRVEVLNIICMEYLVGNSFSFSLSVVLSQNEKFMN